MEHRRSLVVFRCHAVESEDEIQMDRIERRHTPGALANRKGFNIAMQYTMRAGDTGIWNTKPAGRPKGALNSKSSTITPMDIKMARRCAGLTQARLGIHIGVSKITVSCWERGTRRPSISAEKLLLGLICKKNQPIE